MKNPNVEPKYVKPLKRICMTIGQLPSSYLETMSYYEMLVWFVEFLRNQVIPALDNNAEAVRELQQLYVELKDYVDNYFNNLDVQEEINNKLDEMLENGELEQIIEQFLQSTALWCFDSVEDMKNATNLINGSYAETMGYYEINDGGKATYKITNVESETDYQEELENGLYANLIVKNEMCPEQFGAKGDGTTDDTNAIIKCLNNSKEIIMNKTYKCAFGVNEISNSFNLYGTGTIKLDKITFNETVNIEGIKFIFDNVSNLGVTLNGNNSKVINCTFDNENINNKTVLLSINGNNTIVENSSFLNNQDGRAGIMAISVNNCIVKNCYFYKMGETAVTFMGHSKNCLADGNIAVDCALLGNLTDGVFSTYADYDNGIYTDNIGFINNQVIGDVCNYCFRFDGILNGYAKNNYINVGDCKRVFRVQDRVDHEIKLYTKNVDISNNNINVNSTGTCNIVGITSQHNGLNVNITNNIVKSLNNTVTSAFVEMAQNESFTGNINIENNDVDLYGNAISYNSGASTLVNYNMLNNKIKYNGRVVFNTSGRVNAINNYLESNTNHMIQLNNCECIIINNILVNSSQNPDIYNVGSSATMLTPLSNTLVQITE